MVSVVVAGGGTAGHTSPLIATVDALREALPGVEVVAIGTPKGLEGRVIPAAGIELEMIDPVPLPRRPTPELLKVPWHLRRAVRQAGSILRTHHGEVLVGFGGYVSMPAYLAARRMGVPVVIHEQNAVPGLANKVAARFAERVLTAFPDTPLPHAEFIGLPLRPELVALAENGRESLRAEARAGFGLDADRPTLLVSGGSQGARSINEALEAGVDALLVAGVQILHVLGRRNMTPEHVVREHPVTGARYVPVAYVDAMERAYAAADLMVGRSGAGTVVETAVVGLPGLFVPLPHGNGEQARNAEPLVRAHAAALIPDHELTADRLVSEVLLRITDPQWLATMSDAAKATMPATAARQLAAIVLDVVAARGRPGGGTGSDKRHDKGNDTGHDKGNDTNQEGPDDVTA